MEYEQKAENDILELIAEAGEYTYSDLQGRVGAIVNRLVSSAKRGF